MQANPICKLSKGVMDCINQEQDRLLFRASDQFPVDLRVAKLSFGNLGHMNIERTEVRKLKGI